MVAREGAPKPAKDGRRTAYALAVHPEHRGHRIGDRLLGALVGTARELGLSRLFALTFHTDFFARHGIFQALNDHGSSVHPKINDTIGARLH